MPDNLISNAQGEGAQGVDDFHRLIMLPDPVSARRHRAAPLHMLISGRRTMHEPVDCTKFNASRYKWVKKRIERTETVAFEVKAIGSADWLLVRAWPSSWASTLSTLLLAKAWVPTLARPVRNLTF